MYGDRCGQEFLCGLNAFLSAAVAYKISNHAGYICCPCKDCNNQKQSSNAEQICEHLLYRGFKAGYTCQIKHGEDETIPEEQPMVQDEDAEDNDMCVEEDNDTFVEQDNDMPVMEDTQFDDDKDDISRLLRDGEVDLTDIRMFEKFQKMHQDSTTPLFSGCKEKHTKLHTVLTLFQMKASNGWSDKSFIELLGFLQELLLEDNMLPENTYYAKKVICPLGLELRKYM